MADQSLTSSVISKPINPPAGSGSAGTASREKAIPSGPAWLLGMFSIALTLGVSFNLAGVQLSPLRILLLIAIGPLLVKLVSGQMGRVTAVDWLLVFLCLWTLITTMMNDGLDRLMFSLVSVIELFGSYLLGRYLVRDEVGFRRMVKWHLIALAVMFPFALAEFLTGTQYWARILDVFGDVQYRRASSRPRYGFNRVLAGFDHPILFGVYCSMAAATVVYTWRSSWLAAGLRLAFVGVMTLFSLSSGAVLSVAFQLGFMIWGLLTGNRWILLAGLYVAGFIFLELASNRGPFIIFVETLAFDSGTGWTRILQWEYAGAEVLQNPIFGKGIDTTWERPAWLYTSSIDSYWLVIAFRYGFPAIGALLLALALHSFRIFRAKDLSADATRMRLGYMFVLLGVSFSLITVHIWDANVVFFYFFIGIGVWFSDGGSGRPAPAEGPKDVADIPAHRYSRFAPTRSVPPPSVPATPALPQGGPPPSRPRGPTSPNTQD